MQASHPSCFTPTLPFILCSSNVTQNRRLQCDWGDGTGYAQEQWVVGDLGGDGQAGGPQGIQGAVHLW